jgi:hypothetical protein
VAPELVAVHGLLADVKPHQQQPAGRQHPPQLAQRGHHLGLAEVDQRVESDDARQRSVWELERPHVADAELDLRRAPAGLLDHAGRQVDPEHPGTLLVEIARHVAGPAAEIDDGPTVAHLLREPVQQVPVERLAGQLRVDALGVRGRELVIALAVREASSGPPVTGDYPIDELAIRDEPRTAVDVVRRIEKGRFVLDPDFQRGFVWDEKKQSRLIESILMRIPLPVFYVAEDAEGRLIVVDGRQRVTTLKRFISGELKLDLEDRKDLHGKKFDELEARLQNRVEDCQLRFYIIDHKVPERARLDIFERVNGGEVLTRQQMRNAISNGAATQFLKDEAATQLFQEATGGSLDAKKMQDREFVNRFCSFSLLALDSYKGDMDDWLARGLKALEKLSNAETQALSTKFRLGLKNNVSPA